MSNCLSPVYGQLELLADLNKTVNSRHNEYSQLTNAGPYMYFVSNNELWKSNGTTQYTSFLKAFDSISNLTISGATLYFTADDGDSGLELWKSNGSARTTVKVRDIVPGSDGASPLHLTDVNGILYFSAWTPAYGRELWKSDGTAAGTMLIEDIARGNANPENLVNVNGTLYFSAHTPTGIELWKSQGTPASTSLVKDIYPGIKSGRPRWLTASGGKLFFTALQPASGRELWISDGTPGGTRLLKDIRPGTASSIPENLTDVNGTLMFSADDGVHGDELWKSNGFSAGTVLVKDLNPGRAGSNHVIADYQSMGYFTNINGVLYFIGSKGTTDYIYRSDGTATGTVIVTEALLGTEYGAPKPEFTYHNNYVYFFNGTSGDHIFGLHRMLYKGTQIQLIKTLAGPLDFNQFVPMEHEMIRFNNNVYFFGRMVEQFYDNQSFTFIRSNGTTEGTVTVFDTFVPTDGSDLRQMISVSGIVYVLSKFWYIGTLYRTDGTPEGTYPLRPEANYAASDAIWEPMGTTLYFVEEGVLYRTDGTMESTIRLNYASTGQVLGLSNVNGMLYFYNDIGQLWKTNGTDEETQMVGELNSVRSVTNVAGQAFIISSNSENQLQVWKDGNSGPLLLKTFPVGPISPPWEGADPTAALNGIFYFIANDGVHGYQVWKSNGTPEGTEMMFGPDGIESDTWTGFDAPAPVMIVYRDTLFINHRDNDLVWHFSFVSGDDLVEIQEIDHIRSHVIVNDKLFMFIRKEIPLEEGEPLEVFVKDGNAPAQLLASIPAPYYQFDYGVVGNMLYFNAESGKNLWRTDGTVCGTSIVDVTAGSPYALEGLGNDLIFGGYVLVTGTELYTYHDVNSISGPTCPDEPSSLADNQHDELENMTLAPYPNPFIDSFSLTVNGAETQTVHIAVYTASGYPVERMENLEINSTHRIGASWQKGFYIIKVATADKLHTYHVVKK